MLNAAAVGLALAAGAVPALADTGTRESVTVGPGGTVRRTSESTSDPGLGLVGLAIAALCAIPLLLRRPEHAATARRVLAVGLVAFSLVGAMSIGLLFLPSALAMLAAALTSRDR